MIAIVNYGSGNIQAIANIYKRASIPFLIASCPADLAIADHIVLPGVGAFDQAIEELQKSGLRQAMDQAVLADRKPILGICVGMQILASTSEEGTAFGLGWINGIVKRFDLSALPDVAGVPHMGWNTVEPLRANPLFEGVDLDSEFYFLHSYYFCCNGAEDRLGVTMYGTSFASAIHRANIWGVQFHPEKSHDAGVQMLRNFAAIR